MLPKSTGVLLAYTILPSSEQRESCTRVHASLVQATGWVSTLAGPYLGVCVYIQWPHIAHSSKWCLSISFTEDVDAMMKGNKKARDSWFKIELKSSINMEI